MPSNVFEAFTANSGATANTACDTTCLTSLRQRLDTLNTTKINQDAMANDISAYRTIVNNLFAKVSEPNAASQPTYSQDVSDLISNLGRIQDYIKRYHTEVVQLSATLVKDASSKLNINNQVNMLGEVLSESASSQSKLLDAQESLSTAYTREATIDTKDDAISYQQTWGYIARPLKRNSIPILIVFTLLFFGVGIVGLWFVSPYAAAMQSISSGEVGFFQHPAVWMTMVIVVVILLILGALKLGKQI